MKRIATIIVSLVAWFALSNHCLLGAACTSAPPAAKGCPMHLKSSNQTPTKQNDVNEPCCKTVRALIVVKVKASPNTLDFVLKPFFTDTPLSVMSRPSRCLIALDTGPPEARSFSESVLQRSILAHAPPRFV